MQGGNLIGNFSTQAKTRAKNQAFHPPPRVATGARV
jgi:hypothetical protein